jgi:hexosaminidase
MKKILTLIFSAAIIVNSCTTAPKSYNQGINIIPVPANMTLSEEGGRFTLTKDVVFCATDPEAIKVADFFASKIKLSTGYNLKVVNGKYEGKCIEFDLNTDLKAEEYELEVDNNKVEIEASSGAGFFYGMTSFMQLLPAEIESGKLMRGIEWSAPEISIKDAPRFEYRGFMLDVCRHFIPAEDVKKHIDIISMFKINNLHLHLTEDQGWRIEIKKYPELTEAGAFRIEGEGNKYGGFYTQEELRDIVAYAAQRQVNVIPELEIPGHELAAIAAYSHLSCNNEKTTPRIIWGVEETVMCPGKEDMFIFLEDVIKEMVEIFPSEYYHIGGDECPKAKWENCPACQARIKSLGLKADKRHTAEEKLQSYVIGRIEGVLAKYGKKIIGWDEILEGGLAPSATVMSWRGEYGGIASALMNHDVIMTPASNGLYINFYHGDPKVEPVAIGGESFLDQTYSYNPVPDTLVKMGKESFIKGAQVNLWGEYLYSPKLYEYHAYPSVLAIAEATWSNLENKNYEDFCRRLNNAYVRMDAYDINYHLPLPEQPGGSCNMVAFTDKAVLEFTTSRPIKIVYTVNGSTPNAESSEYVKPLTFTQTTTLKICSVLPSGRTSTVRTIKVEKQNLAPATHNIAELESGLVMKTTEGMFLNSDQLNLQQRVWNESKISSIETIRGQINFTEQTRDPKQYAAIAEGFINIPEDGVYYFSSNNNEVWIDGKLLIDNNNEVKRYSRNDASAALAGGCHSIKVIFLGHIIGGWPSNWDDGSVLYREVETPDFKPVSGDMLYRTK